MQCEICGKEAKLIKAEIEGAVMNVCSDCATLGRNLEIHTTYGTLTGNSSVNSASELVENFGEVIKTARNSLNLSLEDFANKINEKSSVLKRVENGSLSPYEKLAKKIEKELNISLYGIPPNAFQVKKQNFKKETTLGDVVRIKTKHQSS